MASARHNTTVICPLRSQKNVQPTRKVNGCHLCLILCTKATEVNFFCVFSVLFFGCDSLMYQLFVLVGVAVEGNKNLDFKI